MTTNPKTCGYSPWEDHGVHIAQCVDYDYRDSSCSAELGPYYKQACPWENGYPPKNEVKNELP